MFGVSQPHLRGLGAPTIPKPGTEDDVFEPDSKADREHRAVLEKIEQGKKMEKGMLASRSAVAQVMLAAGGKINIDAAGLAVMQKTLPNTGAGSAMCAPPPKDTKKGKKKAKKKEKKKDKKKVKKKDKKKDKKKKDKKKDKKKKSSSSESSSDSTSSSVVEAIEPS